MWRKVVLLALANCVFADEAAILSKDCEIPKNEYAAPVFQSADNLSYERCGLWDKIHPQPWRVAISGPIGAKFSRHCFGTLISPTAVISWVCGSIQMLYERSNDKTGWKAYVGKCVEEVDDPKTCEEGGKGQILQVEHVNEAEILSFFEVHIWRIKGANLVENYVWPLCLFNRNNQLDYSAGQNYRVYHTKNQPKSSNYSSDAVLVEDKHSCMKNKTIVKCSSMGKMICVHYTTLGYYPLLINEDAERFYLRALNDHPGKDLDVDFYLDLLSVMPVIVDKSTDLAPLSRA